jgi:hypothetical protein
MLTSALMVGGRSSLAANWNSTLETDAYAGYATNPALLPGASVTDELALLAVDASTIAQTDRAQLSVTPRFSITRYLHEGNLDTTTGSIDLASLYNFERAQLTFSGQVLTDSTLQSEQGLTGITNVNRRHDAGTATIGYQYSSTERLAWQVQAAGQVTRYSADAEQYGLIDYHYGSASFGPIWSFSERLQGSITFEADRLVPEVGVSQNDYSATLQLKRKFTEKYGWRVSVGTTHLEAAEAGSANLTSFEVGATRQGERVQWDVSAKQAVLPIGIGLLTKQNLAGLSVTAATSEHSTLGLSANIIRSYPLILPAGAVYSGAKWGQASLEWKYVFLPHWAFSALYVQAHSRNGDWNEWANSNQARLGIVWQNGHL